MTQRPRVVAVTGIDGCGKSSVIRRFTERWPAARGQALTLTCPTYHQTPNAPFARLSERLHHFSRAADSLGSFELKGAALYLQMTLHGPVEQCLLDAYRPAFLLTEHHSLVDTLAYGAIYTALIRTHADPSFERPLREQLDARAPGTYEEIVSWTAVHSERTGMPSSVFELGLSVARVLARPRAEIIPELAQHYGTDLPDVLVVLDLPATLAIERLRARGDAQGELHEQGPMLEQLRRQYHEVAAYLTREHPATDTIVIDVASSASVDETLHEVIRRAGLGSELFPEGGRV